MSALDAGKGQNSVATPSELTKRPTANSRATRKLVTWTNEKNAHLIVAVDHVCKEHGIKIPYEQVAKLISNDTSAGAIEQHISKLRNNRIRQGLPTHPPTKRSRKMVNLAPVPVKQSIGSKGRARRGKRSYKPVFDNGIDPDAVSDPDGEFGAPSAPRKKGTKGRKRAKPKSPTPTPTPPTEGVEDEDGTWQTDETIVKQEPLQSSTLEQNHMLVGQHDTHQMQTGFCQENAGSVAPMQIGPYNAFQGDDASQYLNHQYASMSAPVTPFSGHNGLWSVPSAPQNGQYAYQASGDFTLHQSAPSTGFTSWQQEPRTPVQSYAIEEPSSAGTSLESFDDFGEEPIIGVGIPGPAGFPFTYGMNTMHENTFNEQYGNGDFETSGQGLNAYW